MNVGFPSDGYPHIVRLRATSQLLEKQDSNHVIQDFGLNRRYFVHIAFAIWTDGDRACKKINP